MEDVRSDRKATGLSLGVADSAKDARCHILSLEYNTRQLTEQVVPVSYSLDDIASSSLLQLPPKFLPSHFSIGSLLQFWPAASSRDPGRRRTLLPSDWPLTGGRSPGSALQGRGGQTAPVFCLIFKCALLNMLIPFSCIVKPLGFLLTRSNVITLQHFGLSIWFETTRIQN